VRARRGAVVWCPAGKRGGVTLGPRAAHHFERARKWPPRSAGIILCGGNNARPSAAATAVQHVIGHRPSLRVGGAYNNNNNNNNIRNIIFVRILCLNNV